MTITISQRAHEELWQEVDETRQSNDPDEELDITCKCPQALGEGYSRRVELRQSLLLEIESYQRHDNLIIQSIDHPHPLEFWFMLSGQWRESSSSGVNETEAGQYGFCGSGMAVKGENEFSQGQQLVVGVHLVPNATTATKTDTPLRDIPQSIQVVPRQVLEDRNVRTLNQSVETVSGVSNSGDLNGATGGGRSIRAFASKRNLRNGFSEGSASFDNLLEPVGTIEQVEVLKGPASVLFGALEPGGIVNVVTKQPLSEPYYKLEFEAGNYGLYQPLIDFSGPLTADKTVLYRLIASYQGANGFQDFVNTQLTTLAPSITVNLGDRTSLNLYYEYTRFFADPPRSFVPLLSDGSLPPKSFYATYPDLYFNDITTQKFGYTLKHKFSNNWQLRNNVAVVLNSNTRNEAFPSGIVDDRFLTGYGAYEGDIKLENYFGQIDVLGKFNTGSISHQLLVGFDINRFFTDFAYLTPSIKNLPDLDILNPNYNIPRPEFDSLDFAGTTKTQSYGVYLQDQIAFSDNLKLLLGGRYDWLSNEDEPTGSEQTEQNDGAFSPRIGLVYQPSKTVSLYTSYSRSFSQSTGFNPDGRAFEPSRGTQYEVGVKTDFLDGKLSTTLAAYQLTKTNVLTPDPERALLGFSN